MNLAFGLLSGNNLPEGDVKKENGERAEVESWDPEAPLQRQ